MGGIVDGALGGAIGAGIVGLFGLFVWLPLVKTFKDPSKAGFQAMRQMLKTEWKATQRYRSTLGTFLGWVDGLFDGDTVNPSPWSAMAYDRSIRLAIIYPVLSALMIWVLGGSLGAGGIVFGISSSISIIGRIVVPFALFFQIWLMVRSEEVDGWEGWNFSLAAIVVAFISTLIFDLPISFPFFLAACSSLSIVIVFSGGKSIFMVIFFSCVFSMYEYAGNWLLILYQILFAILIFATGYIFDIFKGSVSGFFESAVFLTIVPILIVFSVIYFFSSSIIEGNPFTMFAVLVLVPLINAIYDWISIGFTRFILRKTLGDASGIWPTIRSFLDLGGATVLLILLAMTLVSVLTFVDQISYAKGMTTAIVGVDAVLADILLEPAATQHWWIYFTLFSTLIPTFIHGVIWVGSLLSVRPKVIDLWILREMDEVAATKDPEDRIGHARRAAALVLGQWAVATFLVGAACYLIWTATDHLTGAGEAFLTLLIWVQEMTAAGAAWLLW